MSWAGCQHNPIYLNFHQLTKSDLRRHKGWKCPDPWPDRVKYVIHFFYIFFDFFQPYNAAWWDHMLLLYGHWSRLNLNNQLQGKLKLGMSDDDVTILPWLPSNIFLVVCMIWFSYTNKLYIKMLEFSKKNNWYHLHQQFLFKI